MNQNPHTEPLIPDVAASVASNARDYFEESAGIAELALLLTRHTGDGLC